MFDVIIVGSGPAGIAAALSIKDKTKPLILDVGNIQSNTEIIEGNFYDKKLGQSHYQQIVGKSHEYFSNLHRKK